MSQSIANLTEITAFLKPECLLFIDIDQIISPQGHLNPEVEELVESGELDNAQAKVVIISSGPPPENHSQLHSKVTASGLKPNINLGMDFLISAKKSTVSPEVLLFKPEQEFGASVRVRVLDIQPAKDGDKNEDWALVYGGILFSGGANIGLIFQRLFQLGLLKLPKEIIFYSANEKSLCSVERFFILKGVGVQSLEPKSTSSAIEKTAEPAPTQDRKPKPEVKTPARPKQKTKVKTDDKKDTVEQTQPKQGFWSKVLKLFKGG